MPLYGVFFQYILGKQNWSLDCTSTANGLAHRKKLLVKMLTYVIELYNQNQGVFSIQ